MGFNEFENCNTISFKWLEVPIEKFNDVVPHFVESLKTHQSNIVKLRRLKQWREEHQEQIAGTQIMNQLVMLLSEMENLRSQVLETDLNKFDRSIYNAKQSAKTVIRSFQEILSKSSHSDQSKQIYSEELQYEDNTSGHEQLVAIADLSEAIKVQERKALSMMKLEEDIQDMNYMFQQLSEIVHEQGEAVNKVEAHVETTHANVTTGERMLAQAVRYKKASYPLMGAVIGTVLAGPVGLFAGLKLGSLTAVGAGVLGYTGGRMLKNQEEEVLKVADRHSEEIKNN